MSWRCVSNWGRKLQYGTKTSLWQQQNVTLAVMQIGLMLSTHNCKYRRVNMPATAWWPKQGVYSLPLMWLCSHVIPFPRLCSSPPPPLVCPCDISQWAVRRKTQDHYWSAISLIPRLQPISLLVCACVCRCVRVRVCVQVRVHPHTQTIVSQGFWRMVNDKGDQFSGRYPSTRHLHLRRALCVCITPAIVPN